MTFDLSRRFVTGGLLALATPSVLRAQTRELNLYSSRHYDTDEAFYGEFTKGTGIKINRIEAEADALLERLRSEGANSPADVLITVDAGRIERAKQMGLLQAYQSDVLSKSIPAHLRDPENTWFGMSARARIILVSRERVAPGAITRYEDLADPKWKGKVVARSSAHIYNQSLTGAMLAALGPEKTEGWAKGVAANFARAPKGGDTDQIKAVAAGEADIAIANSYYFGNLLGSKKPEEQELARKLLAIFPNQADRGTHVNISAAGIAAKSPNLAAAKQFLDYMASPAAQRYFGEGNSEFPVVAGTRMAPQLAALGAFKQDALNAGTYARNNAEALKIMDRAGWK